ncbi:Coiled-coil domain-containing protein 58 [Mycena venus]|uniref:Coiled-coil domain-containing protein 58 n=1 Tax=Mycena venus TaxID=2733690 RepID=A0A8H7CYP9_9AGAR|nr:Coiled-coil domain-containing protein 58 [Mycena venus]
MPTPILGSASLQSPSPATQIVSVSRSTCTEISSFKELLREYRKLDDSINIRLNRETALVRDQERNVQGGEQKAAQAEEDPARRRTIEAGMFSDDVKRNQVRDELTIDAIVRKRSLQAFRSRCRYFVPPLTDSEARKMWDAASE